MGKILRKKSLSEVGVRLGRDLEDPAKSTLAGNVRIPRVITGILPCVRNTKQNLAMSPTLLSGLAARTSRQSS